MDRKGQAMVACSAEPAIQARKSLNQKDQNAY